MLSVYVAHGTTLERIPINPGSLPPDEAVWIDMVTPTVQEDKLVDLVSVGRLLSFLANEAGTMKWPKDTRAQLQSMQRDTVSLSDHVTYLSNKITFLLDALLGIVSIQQNDIIKIFSIAAVGSCRRRLLPRFTA
jgi:Mg2+ and Co2+ transporter CorA